MPLLQLILETTGMIVLGLVALTQVIVPLWFGKRLFWLFRRRSGKAQMEVIPPGQQSYASKYTFGRGASSAASASHEKRNR